MFKKTRIRLTAWYLLIIMFVSVFFSMVIYRFLSVEVERFGQMQRLRIERKLNQPNINFRFPVPTTIKADLELVEETKERIALSLIVINGTIFILAGALGYLLAGKTLKPIQEMVDEQNRFISDASHELRTPLTSLKTAMEVNLRDKNLSLENAKILINESITDVNKLQLLSEELLKLTQYEQSNNNLKFETINLSDVIKEAVSKTRLIALKKEIAFNQKIQNHRILGNKYGLIDLIIILLDNAIKYSPKKSEIVISTKVIDGFISLSILDKGIGISEKDIPHIFDRFYRADSARSKSNIGGYGLGLSIAKKIVDIHRGSIYIESKLKKGTTVIIHFPKK